MNNKEKPMSLYMNLFKVNVEFLRANYWY